MKMKKRKQVTESVDQKWFNKWMRISKVKMEVEMRCRDVKTVGMWQDGVGAMDMSDEKEVRNATFH